MDKEERIRQRAYEKWQKEGAEHGWHERHWAEAEREIDSEEGSFTDSGPMMDDAGMPDADQIQAISGESAATAAITGVETKKRRPPAKKRSS
jgi:hypothetical protein